MTTITPQDAIDFMSAHLADLHKNIPGYVSLELCSTAGIGNPRTRFRAYSEHLGHSSETNDPTKAIAELAEKAKGKTESELLRENAAQMLRKAEELEGRTA